jgi:cytochrome c biogenesis protein ResB
MFFYVSLSFVPSVYLSLCFPLPIFLSLCLSFFLYVSLSFSMFIFLSLLLFLSFSLLLCLSIRFLCVVKSGKKVWKRPRGSEDKLEATTRFGQMEGGIQDGGVEQPTL